MSTARDMTTAERIADNLNNKSAVDSKLPRGPRSKKRMPFEETFLLNKSDVLLSLAGKCIRKLSPGDLEKLRKYHSLDLSHNHISLTDQLCFEFKFLRTLNLSHNELNSLPQDLHLMENLTAFNVSDNAIEKLPLNIYQMNRLRYLDIRGNPFYSKWNARRELDPNLKINLASFTAEVKAFLKAVKDWRDFNLGLKAEEYLEYLLICPSVPPSCDNADFAMKIEEQKHCPVYSLMQTQPDQVKQLISFLDLHLYPDSKNEAEHQVLQIFNRFAGYAAGIIRIGLWNLVVLFLLAVAFLDREKFEWVTNWLPNVFQGALRGVHGKIQSYCNLFPISPPAVSFF